MTRTAPDPPCDFRPCGRRNPPPLRLRRGGVPADLAELDRLRRALVRRRGCPRGAGPPRKAARDGGVWFLGVDARAASVDWLLRVAAVAPRPRASPGSPQGRAWLAGLEALKPWAQAERAALRGPMCPA